MSKNPYDSKLLAALRDEEKFDQEHQRGQRTVKIEKGHVWTVRFLPVTLGEDGTWYARIARHWLNKKPIICPVDTAKAFGGDKEAYCPCCTASSEINRSSDEEISKFGWSTRAGSQRLTFCVVLDKDGEQVTGNEMLMAYEFWHYQNTWDELKAFFIAGTRGGKNLTSVLDYKNGNDFAVSRNAKGMRLDKLDGAPIFDPSDPNFEAYIKKIEDSVKPPKIKIPTPKELEVFAAKIEEEAERLARGSGGPSRPSRRVSAASDEDLEGSAGTDAEPEEPVRPARRPAPALPPVKTAARRPAPAAEEPAAEDDTNSELSPARPVARRAAPAAEEATEADEQPVRPQTTVPRRKVATEEAVAEADPDADIAPEPASEEEPAEEPVAARRAVTPTAGATRSGPKRATPIQRQDKVDDDPDTLPEESVDQAPPVKQPLRRAVSAELAEEEPTEAPPAPARKTGMGSALRDKVRQANARDE